MANWNSKANDIFVRAAEIDAPAERQLFVQQQCRGDADLHAQVESLLAAGSEAGSFLEKPAANALAPNGATAAYPPLTEGPGTTIGAYKLMEQIGEGGFGLVFVAEQQRPVRRKVALKILKPGMDTRDVIARFEAERQALALMEHPNIARVFDGGASDSGRPYFVMELVKGIPLIDYCDQQQLTARERLQLFLSVCQAVQHAHGKGIIHRDLKPSNILVAPHDGTPVVKVIDFGIAKALGQQLTDKTIYTRFIQMVGTPLYMSPEQAEINALDVDIRSDVYSLGVLLYELLTGTTPFDRQRFQKAAYDEIRRIIKEEEPPPPSTRLSTMGAPLSKVSAQRRTEPAKLSALVKGDLDWIVMRCLEKDRTRRYETANGLARDVERYLKDEPVEACPPTAGYKLRKFARKNKKLLATAAAFAALLLLGVAGSAWQAVRATQAEAVALANEKQADENAEKAQIKEQEANKERDEVRALNEKLRETQAQLQRTLYVAQMNLAQHACEAGAVERIRELLDQQRPKKGEMELRGFEWHYLDRLSHEELVTLNGHTRPVVSVAYSPDGKLLASSEGGDGGFGTPSEVKVWDAQTGKELFSIKDAGPRRRGLGSGGDEDRFYRGLSGARVTFSPDSKRLACASPARVKVWDAQTGKELLDIKGVNRSNVNAVAFSPDGKRLACGIGGGTTARVCVWDAETGAELLILKANEHVTSVAFSPDGQRLAASVGVGRRSPSEVKVWDAQTGQELFTLKGHSREVRSVAFSPDGKHLATGSSDKTVMVWDAQTGKELNTLEGHTNSVLSVAFSQDGKRLASASEDKTVKLWDVQTGAELFAFKGHSGSVVSLAFSPDGRRLASASEDKTVKVWDAEKEGTAGKPLTDLEKRKLVRKVAFSSDGKRLASVSGDGMVKLWDVQTGRELRAGHNVRFRESDLQCVASDEKVWDSETGELLLPSPLIGVARVVSADGKRLAGPVGGPWMVWDAQTGKKLFSFGTRDPVVSVAFSPDGKHLASGSGHALFRSDPGVVKVLDAQTGQELLNLKGHTGGVKSVAFSPDGYCLASASSDNTIKVWDAQTGQELLNLKGHSGEVTAVAYSPDGKRLASTSGDKTLKVWDAQTGAELLSLEGHGGSDGGVAFSPDGHRLAAGARDGTVKIWDATPLPVKR